MKHIVKASRKLIALIIGLPLIVVGIVLIPLPGPGVFIVLLGASVLSMEYEFAQKLQTRAIDSLRAIYERSMDRYHQMVDDTTR